MSNAPGSADLWLDKPQVCPSDACGADLKDYSVPPDHAQYQTAFTMAMSGTDRDTGKPMWLCPVCKHQWERVMPSRQMRRSMTKRLAKLAKKGRA